MRYEVTVKYETLARFLVEEGADVLLSDDETKHLVRDYMEVFASDLVEEGKAFETIGTNFKVVHVGVAPTQGDHVVKASWPDEEEDDEVVAAWLESGLSK